MKTIFIVDVNPFDHKTPDHALDDFIYAHELVEQTEDNYLLMGVIHPGDVVRFPRELYVGFDTRDEALLHLERIVLNKVQEIEEELSKWKQFNTTIEVEIMSND